MMKKIAFTASLALVLLAVVMAQNNKGDDITTDDSDNFECSDTGFAKWGKKHNKNLNNAADENVKKQKRKSWDVRCKQIKDHNEKFNRGEVSYKLALNNAADWTEEELKARRGYRRPPSASSSQRKKRQTAWNYQPTSLYRFDKTLGLKPSVYWNGTTLVGPVLDQGFCGSCWAFSGVGALEGAYAKKYGNYVKASEQNIIDCSTDSYGCDGGFLQSVWWYTSNNGVDSIASYPDTTQDTAGVCKYTTKNTVIYSSGYSIVDYNETAIAQALSKFGPLAVGIDATYLDFYSSGVYNDPLCSTTDINHAILLVGYGTIGTTDVWLLKNSWGSAWGMQGYFYMRRGVNMCGIISDAQFPTVK